MNHPSPGPLPRRLPEFEGLRGLLSWWVVVCHALLHAGYSAATLGRGLRLLVHGDYAVDVFIILSGFVIHKLWHDAREPWRLFVVRRFLRLWPAFAVCLAAAAALHPLVGRTGQIMPTLGDASFAARRLALWRSEEAGYWLHLAAHLPMLHGLVPDPLLPGAAVAFIGAAWSISLEWQFYLVAPLLFAWLRHGRAAAWVAFAAVAGLGWLWRYTSPVGDWFPMESFLWQKLLLFGIGIASHEFWRLWHHGGKAIAPVLAGCAGLALFFTLWLPLAIWLGALAAVLAAGGPVKRLLNSAPLQFLGAISYSTYLCHMLVFWLLQAVVVTFTREITAPAMLAVLVGAGFPITLLLSMGLHRWVEQPAIDAGRRLRGRPAWCPSARAHPAPSVGEV